MYFATNKVNSVAVAAYQEHCEETINTLEKELDEFFEHCIYTPDKIKHITELLSEYYAYSGKEYIKKLKENTIV